MHITCNHRETVDKAFTSYADVESKIRCTVSPVLPLSDAELTCHFPEDLSITKKVFTVYHYAQHGSPGDKTTV